MAQTKPYHFPSFLGPQGPSSDADEAHHRYGGAWAAWMSEVDKLLINLCGLDSGSLEDWCWFDAFDEELSEQEAVDEWRIAVLREYGVGTHN